MAKLVELPQDRGVSDIAMSLFDNSAKYRHVCIVMESHDGQIHYSATKTDYPYLLGLVEVLRSVLLRKGYKHDGEDQ